MRTYTARSEKLLRLVNDNRVQLFPRGVAELDAEASVVRSLYPQMLLDPHLLIVIPLRVSSMWLQRTRSWQPRFRPVLNG